MNIRIVLVLGWVGWGLINHIIISCEVKIELLQHIVSGIETATNIQPHLPNLN